MSSDREQRIEQAVIELDRVWAAPPEHMLCRKPDGSYSFVSPEGVTPDSWVLICGIEPFAEACRRLDNERRPGPKPGQEVLWSEEWNGQGLPPVGTECEFRAKGGSLEHGQNIEWKPCEVIVTTRAYAILRHIGRAYTDNHECSHNLSSIEFRPIQSHRDKVIEAALKVVHDRYGQHPPVYFDRVGLAALYEAGALKLPEKTNDR